MGKFLDTDTSLQWKRFNSNNPKQFSSYNKIIDSWSSNAGVKKYITTSDPRPVTCMFMDFLGEESNIFYCFEDERLIGTAFISGPYSNTDSATIEYIIVDPKAQGRGLATRMIKSITNNPKFFIGEKYNGKIVASIHKENIGSQKAFLKNSFQVVKKPVIYSPNYLRVLYSEPKTNTMGK